MSRLVAAALRFPGLVLAGALGLLGVGLYCYTQLDVEAYPNPVAPMIEVITQPQGLSAEEVERYVTIPLETGLAGMVEVAAFAARTGGLPPLVTITSTLRATRSTANAGSRSLWSSAHRYSIATFCPSM